MEPREYGFVNYTFKPFPSENTDLHFDNDCILLDTFTYSFFKIKFYSISRSSARFRIPYSRLRSTHHSLLMTLGSRIYSDIKFRAWRNLKGFLNTSEIFGILLILSFSASDPGRIIFTVAITVVIAMEYVQKAASASLLWAYAESCESDYHCGFCLHFNPLQQFHSLFDFDRKYLYKAHNCVIKYLHTHSLLRGSEQRDITAHFSEFIVRDSWGEQD